MGKIFPWKKLGKKFLMLYIHLLSFVSAEILCLQHYTEAPALKKRWGSRVSLCRLFCRTLSSSVANMMWNMKKMYLDHSIALSQDKVLSQEGQHNLLKLAGVRWGMFRNAKNWCQHHGYMGGRYDLYLERQGRQRFCSQKEHWLQEHKSTTYTTIGLGPYSTGTSLEMITESHGRLSITYSAASKSVPSFHTSIIFNIICLQFISNMRLFSHCDKNPVVFF